MRILLDECVPRGLKRSLAGHDVVTVPEAGLAGLKNGQLLRAADGRFDVLITTDKSIQYQQQLAAYSMTFVLLRARSNDIHDLEPLARELLPQLSALAPGKLIIVQ